MDHVFHKNIKQQKKNNSTLMMMIIINVLVLTQSMCTLDGFFSGHILTSR